MKLLAVFLWAMSVCLISALDIPSSVFRDAKKKIREANKLDSSGLNKVDLEDVDQVFFSDLVEIDSPVKQEWTSLKGSSITAKLLRIEAGAKCVFENPTGGVDQCDF